MSVAQYTGVGVLTGIGVSEQRGEREDDLEEREGGGPVVFEDVDAYASAVTDVHVVYPRANDELACATGHGYGPRLERELWRAEPVAGFSHTRGLGGRNGLTDSRAQG